MADILSIGKTGLNASKKSLETTGHNIANVNTEGYSRQRVLQSTNIPVSDDGLIQGTGTRITDIKRIHDPHIEKNLLKHTADHKYYKARSEEMSQVENIFNEIDNDGLNHVLNKFYNAFRELANQPENETIRSVVRDSAAIVVKDFHQIQETLGDLSQGLDNKIIGRMKELNSTFKNIAYLNKKIASLEGTGGETGDLRDQRDLAIKKISQSFKVHSYQDNRGNFIVSAVGVGTLVSGGHYQELATNGISKKESTDSRDGSIEIFFKERPSQKITHRFQSGEITSFVRVRNEDIKNLRETIDQIAFDFANTVNAIHQRGYANREIEVGADGQPVVSYDNKGPITGINFFKVNGKREGAALSLELSDEVKSDLSNIVTGLAPNSPGDNRIAIGISKLQHEKFMEGGTATIEEHFLKTIGNIGIEVGKAKLDSEQSEGVLVQTKSLKERISGVSIDEETANLMRFQHAYQASAKVMQTANEMFDTVLSIKR